jgi:hypothetical protein
MNDVRPNNDLNGVVHLPQFAYEHQVADLRAGRPRVAELQNPHPKFVRDRHGGRARAGTRTSKTAEWTYDEEQKKGPTGGVKRVRPRCSHPTLTRSAHRRPLLGCAREVRAPSCPPCVGSRRPSRSSSAYSSACSCPAGPRPRCARASSGIDEHAHSLVR